MTPHHRATSAQTYYGSPVKQEKYGNAGLWPVVGGVGNGVAEEDWCWDLLNPGAAVMQRLFGTTYLFGPCVFLGPLVFLGPCSLGREEPWTSISFSEYGTPD